MQNTWEEREQPNWLVGAREAFAPSTTVKTSSSSGRRGQALQRRSSVGDEVRPPDKLCSGAAPSATSFLFCSPNPHGTCSYQTRQTKKGDYSPNPPPDTAKILTRLPLSPRFGWVSLHGLHDNPGRENRGGG
ncbi:hypothetical protein PAHAL_9G434700 [Panicum hallii]|uniref:Uncharacterized protein n=1 Tax=Panicum hallii TaxID=206008 RepID=A0A2T8I4K5_9POAL|nr:hypothetical protein PAHAL_9G434700 [Panicum hallii]